MLALTSCVPVLKGQAVSLYPASGILKLKAGQVYTASGEETWHSAQRYAACERDAINAIAALKECQNK